MRKRKIITVIVFSLIISLMMTSIMLKNNEDNFSSIPDHERTPPEKIMKVDNIKDIKTSSIGWSERETVKSDIEFNKQSFYPDELIIQMTSAHEAYIINTGYNQLYDNDGNNGILKTIWTTPTASSTSVEYLTKIYCGGAGIFNLEAFAHVQDAILFPNTIYSATIDEDLTVTSDMLDALGYLNLQFSTSGDGTHIHLHFSYYADEMPVEIGSGSDVEGGPIDDVEVLVIHLDQFYFLRNTIENQIRSETQYVSDTVKIHSLTIPSVPHAKEINVYAPTHFSYSSITPTATVTKSSSDYTITSPTELTYEILFTSNSTYLLAIEDTTTNYISSNEANFESGTMGGWFDYREYLGNSPMDAFEVSTDISFDGYHSLHIQTSTDAYPTASLAFDQTETVNLAEGFYFSFWYYWVTTDTFRFSLRNEDDSNWETYTLPTTITDRWIRYCAYFDGTCITSGVKSVEFYGADSSSTMEIYLDGFEIFTISTEISTIDYPSKYEISSTFVSFDGYQNPFLTNEEITFDLWDRTAQTEVSSYETTTNSLGVASWIYESSLEQKEYMIRSYTCNNRFGDYATKELSDTWDFNEGDAEGWDGYQSPTVSNGFAYWEVTPNRIRNTFDDGDIDFTDYPDMVMRYRTNETDHYLKSTAGFDYSTNNYLNPDGNWHIWTKHFVDSFLILQSFLSIRTNNPSWIYLDYILLVENSFFSEFYFTPNYPYNIDYFETIETDEIDFSEGDGEGFSIGTDTYVIVNGLMNCSSTVSSGNNYLSYSFAYDLSVSGYSSMYIRSKVKTGRQAAIQIKDTTSGYGISHSFTDTWKTSLYVFTDSRLYDSDSLQMVIWDSENGDNTESLYVFIDFIRLVHVEEPETFLTNTYLGFGSENDKWISAVYSDNIFLGFYNDPNLVYLNQTLGTHNISRLPVARQGETKAFLYSNIFTYTYQVTEADNYFILLNPPSYDISAGLIYLDIVTYYSNCTYRVMMNESWLGSSVPEGSSVWECDFSSPGFYNFTVFVYQGAEVWSTLTSSITIPESEPAEELQLLFLLKDVDTSVSQIFVNYYTNWQNTSLILFDNSTQLGTELSGEGASIWSFSQVEYYAFHNISICIYHNSVLEFTYYFSFVIQEPIPEEPEELQLLFLTKDADIPAKLIFVNYYTNWENTTCRVFDNLQVLGSYTGEGASIWDFSSVDYYGYHNITIEIYHLTIIQFTVTFGFTVQEPATTIYTVHYDLVTLEGVGLSFETAKIYMNGSRIYASEQYYFGNSILLIEVKDYYNNLIYNTTIQVTDNIDISLPVNLIQQQIENSYDVAVEVRLFSTTDSNANHSYIIASHSSIVILLFTNSYNILVEPLFNEYNNGTHLITYFATSSTYEDLGYEPETYQITMERDVDTLIEPDKSLDSTAKAWLGISLISLLINSVCFAFIGSMGKYGLAKVWNLVMFIPNTIINAVCHHLWGGKGITILVENKGGLEFINPEQYKIIEQNKKEGNM